MQRSLTIFLGSVAVAGGVVLQELTMSSEGTKIMDTWISRAMASDAHPLISNSKTMRELVSHVDVRSAARVLAHKDLPPDVQSMMQVVAQGDSETVQDKEFSEVSLAKARNALNNLIEKSYVEIDDKLMMCKGFEDMNRHTYQQVKLDIDRLTSQINDLERVESEAVEGTNAKDQEIKAVEEMLKQETSEYMREYTANSIQLNIFQNDMDVFQFIMVYTKCKEATSLSQLRAEFELCQTNLGRQVIKFNDAETDAKFKKLLTPQAMRRLDSMLQDFSNRTSLVQQAQPSGKSQQPQGFQAREGVQNGATPQEMSVKCTCNTECGDSKDFCNTVGGLLHDSMSLMWGQHKDKVDELTMIMMKNQYEFEELKSNFNRQIEVLKTAKARLNELLGEARSNMAADNAEKVQKEQQKAELDTQYHKYMASCKKFFHTACLFTSGYISVRNAVHCDSKDCPSQLMVQQDCDWSDWVPSECSVSCDDSCDPSKPYECGGWQEMTREIVQPNGTCGFDCPRLSHYKRCGQYPCPINCLMSEWSSWSSCTADCGGGVRGHTRSIMVKPKNGGTPCNTVEEQEACATGSCDRNCILARWTGWTPCTMACGGGFQEKFRHVALPTRGFGKCPHAQSPYRYAKQSCNTQDCCGNEICIAKQDLVIAIDGSGSVKETGFKVLKDYTKELLDRYRTEYYGQDAVKLAIVLFGNGMIMPDGKTVSPARLVQELTFDMTVVQEKVAGMEFKRGFTNMAQAFSMAETAITLGARRDAHAAVLVITDGKPSFKFNTEEMVEQLDDKAISRYFMLVNSEGIDSDANMLMRSWASQPWMTSVVHVPGGLELLEADLSLWVGKSLVKFCPNAVCEMEMEWMEANYGYAHVKDGAWCGDMGELLSTTTDSVETCAALVSGAGGESFIFGVGFARGKCYLGTMAVDQAQFDTWQKNREKPVCPTEWKTSALYDFYAMEPPASEE